MQHGDWYEVIEFLLKRSQNLIARIFDHWAAAMVKKAPVKDESSDSSSESSTNEELLEQLLQEARKMVMYVDSS